MSSVDSHPSSGPSRVEVFIVDDHPLVREGIKGILELDQRIHVVGEAASAEEAISRVSTLPEIILMDIRLPEMDGIQATRVLLAERPELKIVMLSSFESEYLAAAISAGARGYILKTASQTRLVDAVIMASQGEIPLDSRLTLSLFQRISELSQSEGGQPSQHIAIAGANEVQESKAVREPGPMEQAKTAHPNLQGHGPSTSQQQPAPMVVPLSNREMELLQELGRGLSNKEIADALYITPQTVKNHVTSILRKLNVSDRTQAILAGLRYGWISLESSEPMERM